MEIENKDYLHLPEPMKVSPIRKNKSKYCHFHRDHGHDIEHCRQLRDKIEELICQGYLDKYIQNQDGCSTNDPPQN